MDAQLNAGEALAVLYAPDVAAATLARMSERLAAWPPAQRQARRRGPLAHGDCFAIAYPDHVRSAGEAPLVTLRRVLDAHLADVVTGLHVLPFFPWSSDDGFSIMDYHAVAPDYGDWAAVTVLSERYRLMVDLVLNHASAQGDWFKGFVAGDSRFAGRFVTVDGDPDVSCVVRPRTTPLLTEIATSAGPRRVWTTFGPDQVDLDYRDPATLLAMIDVLLDYVGRGAAVVRLDAVAFVWKEPGTSCLHLPQAHALVRVLRAVLDAAAPDVLLATETNVPHAENVSYFGVGGDEAQLVYNFALPPLVLHTLLAGDVRHLADWAAALSAPSSRATFLNFLASHDGIGLRPVAGMLPEAAVAALVAHVLGQGGRVSRRSTADGEAPYELNINYLDALIDGPDVAGEATGIARFLCAHAMALSLVGVPLLYLHSLLGSRGWPAGMCAGGSARAINRERLSLAHLERALADPTSRRARVRDALADLVAARRAAPAFDPYGLQAVLDLGPACFAVRRTERSGGPGVLCVHNVSSVPLSFDLPAAADRGTALVARGVRARSARRLTLAPYGYVWWPTDE